MLVTVYLIYLFIGISVTIWVASTLHRNGRIFLVDSFLGNEKLADSVNHLLVVGFYLINIGYVSMALKYGEEPYTWAAVIEILSRKVGIVLIVLGVMHFLNIRIFSSMRRRAIQGNRPPVEPLRHVNPPVEA